MQHKKYPLGGYYCLLIEILVMTLYIIYDQFLNVQIYTYITFFNRFTIGY